MKDVRVPGVAWAILIIVLVAVIHGGEGYLTGTLGIQPWMLDLALVMLIGGLKTVNLGTDQLNQALDIIDSLLTREEKAQAAKSVTIAQPGVGMRSSHAEILDVPPPLDVDRVVRETPDRPNPFTRWLVG